MHYLHLAVWNTLDGICRRYKKMVRVVDVVLLRVAIRTANGDKKYLVETSEKYPDGRTRQGLNRLPGTKREPATTHLSKLKLVIDYKM